MGKLQHIIACQAENAPDHVIQEIDDLMDKITNQLQGVMDGIPPNIILSAFNRLHACLIATIVVEDPVAIKNAALAEAKALILNIENISKVEIFPSEWSKDW